MNIDTLPQARLSDPETSHASAARLRARSTIVALLRVYAGEPLHGLTAEQASERVGNPDGAWKRVSDLQRLGLIEPAVDAYGRSVTRTASSGRQQRVLTITGLGVATLAREDHS